MSTSPARSEFATRLQELCEDKGIPERGRQTRLAQQFGVTPNGARKWLLGEGFPEIDIAIAVAEWGEVNFEWLMTGRGPKQGSRVETRALVIGEALSSLPDQERREALDFLRYKLERAGPFVGAAHLARYVDAVDAYADPRLPKKPPAH